MIRSLLLLCSFGLLALSACKDDPQEFDFQNCGINFETTIRLSVIGSDFASGPISEPDSTLGYFIGKSLNNVNIELFDLRQSYAPMGTVADIHDFAVTQGQECINATVVTVGSADALDQVDVADFRSSYVSLLNAAIEWSGGATNIVASPIPLFADAPGVTESQRPQVAARLEAYNIIIQEEASSRGVQLAVLELPNALYGAGIAHDDIADGADGISPNRLLIRTWAEAIALPLLTIVD